MPGLSRTNNLLQFEAFTVHDLHLSSEGRCFVVGQDGRKVSYLVQFVGIGTVFGTSPGRGLHETIYSRCNPLQPATNGLVVGRIGRRSSGAGRISGVRQGPEVSGVVGPPDRPPLFAQVCPAEQHD